MKSLHKYFNIWKQHIDIVHKSNNIKHIISNVYSDYNIMLNSFNRIYNSNDIDHIIQFINSLNKLMTLTNNIPININSNTNNINHIMSAFIINYYPNETNCKVPEIIETAEKIVFGYFYILSHTGIISLANLVNYIKHINNFITLYSKWELEEKYSELYNMSHIFWLSVADIHTEIQTALQTVDMLKKIKNDGQTEYKGQNIDDILDNTTINDDNWKKEFDVNLQNLKNKVLKQVHTLYGVEGVKYFESLVPLFIDPSFTDNIKEVVHNAFWDSLSDDLDKNKFDKLLSLFQELKHYMATCVPNRHDVHKEINENIDIELWKQILENDAHDMDDIVNIINYIYSKLLEWSPVVEIKDIEEEKNGLLSELDNIQNITLGQFISKFLKQVFIRFETIIIKSSEYKGTEEYKNIRNTLKQK